jgi:hypothetical protein
VRLNPDPVGQLRLLSPVFVRIGQKVWDERLARLKGALELLADIRKRHRHGRRGRTGTLALAGIIGSIWFTACVVLQGPSLATDFGACEIHLHVTEAERVGGKRRLPAQDGLDAGPQFARAERFGHVVVGAELEAQHLLGFLSLCGQQDDGGEDTAAPEIATHVEAVLPRQHHVEND